MAFIKFAVKMVIFFTILIKNYFYIKTFYDSLIKNNIMDYIVVMFFISTFRTYI
ncbi:hypothetical protein NPD9_2623 [Clostridium botulinum]|nr:hypothetical protein NPD9_2623 [Clostridium botulinum]